MSVRRGMWLVGIVGMVLILNGPVALWAEEQVSPPSGESGPSRRLPSGRSRTTPQRPVPSRPNQQAPEKQDALPKAKADDITPLQSVTEPVVPPSPDVEAEKPLSSPVPPPKAVEDGQPVIIPIPPSVQVEAPEKPALPPKTQAQPAEKPLASPGVGAEQKAVDLPASSPSKSAVSEMPAVTAPVLQPADAPAERRLPSGRIQKLPGVEIPEDKPATVAPSMAPPVEVEVPETPSVSPKVLVQPEEKPPTMPSADVDQKAADLPEVGPSKPVGEAPADMAPASQPVDAGSEKRLPSGRTRPLPTQPLPDATVVDGSAPTQSEIDDFQRSNFIPIRDRWRIGSSSGLLDPYSQNLLKGDYPIIGQDIFFNFIGISDSLFEARKLPTAQGVSREQAGSGQFFGHGRQLFFNQNFVTSFELFKGSTGFKPRDWAVRVTPVFNVNYLNVQERNVVKLDVRDGTTRTDSQIAFQEAFVEKRLFDISRNYDFISVRAGIQGFTSDFRGFIFSDNEPGARFFGNFDNNRYQWNVAYFNLLEKDTNSQLNSFEIRHRQVVVANLYRQDFIWQGYTTQLSFHHDRDDAGTQDSNGQEYDRNGFLVRPAKVGDVRPHNVHSYYLGWAGDGHIGRFNLSHAFYQVLGNVTHDSIAGRPVSINAQMAAAELSYDIDWLRPKISVFYASGDRNPTDGTARGFDSILDNVNFAGSGFSFFNRQGIALTQTGINLTNRLSLLNDFRSSKTQGQAQFVNPGIIVGNAGLDAELTPKLKAILNFNYLWFAATEPLQYLLHQPQVRSTIGADYSAGLIYRPLLNQNIVLSGGLAYFTPGGGFKDIQQGGSLYSAFFSATLTF